MSARLTFLCSCEESIAVTAGQAGTSKFCPQCRNVVRVPSLSSLGTDAVEAGEFVPRFAGSRFCLAAIFFWLTVASLLLGYSTVGRRLRPPPHDLERRSSRVVIPALFFHR